MGGYGNCSTCESFSKSSLACLGAKVVSEVVIEHSISISYKKGQEVYLEGTPSKGLFCIQKGKVKIYKKCETRSIIINLAGNSDLLGGSSLFLDKFSNSAKCIEESQICFIPKKTVLEIISNNQNFLIQIARLNSIENNKLSNMLRGLKCKNMLGRISEALINIEDKFGLDNSKCIDIALTRKDISELSGTTTASAIRILNDLKRENVITFESNRIKILDGKRLLKYQN